MSDIETLLEELERKMRETQSLIIQLRHILSKESAPHPPGWPDWNPNGNNA